jgi:hypothetical protein
MSQKQFVRKKVRRTKNAKEVNLKDKKLSNLWVKKLFSNLILWGQN